MSHDSCNNLTVDVSAWQRVIQLHESLGLLSKCLRDEYLLFLSTPTSRRTWKPVTTLIVPISEEGLIVIVGDSTKLHYVMNLLPSKDLGGIVHPDTSHYKCYL